MIETAEKVGEVVAASTTEFVAECFRLHEPPPFGCFVRANDGLDGVYGLVCFSETSPLDPSRRPLARGSADSDDDTIYREYPELRELLRTEFTATVIGFRSNGSILHHLPPRPARLHGGVFQCAPDEVRRLTDRFDFLATVVDAGPRVSVDEVLGAALREAVRARGGDRSYLVAAGKELAKLLGPEPNRLNSMLRRIRL